MAELAGECCTDELLRTDPHLEPHTGELRRRYNNLKSLVKRIDTSEGNLDKFSRGYESFGINQQANGGVYCKEWAPGAKAVSLVGEFNDWNVSSHQYQVLPYGKWELYIPPRADGSTPIPHQSKLKLVIVDQNGRRLYRISPWARYVTRNETSPTYDWVHWDPPQRYMRKYPHPPRPPSVRIYEAHVGIASHEGKIATYKNFTAHMLGYAAGPGAMAGPARGGARRDQWWGEYSGETCIRGHTPEISSPKDVFQKPVGKEEFVKVRKRDLERLTTEMMQIKDFLPKILNRDLLHSFHQLDVVETALEKREQENEQLRLDCEHHKARLKTAQEDCQKEREDKMALSTLLQEARQQLLQQAEYCTEMGATVCTLLWSVSSNEDSVKFILAGNKAEKFFSIVGQTMESFVKSLDGNVKEELDPDSDENQFVLALAGIVTNVAAVACGREFLVNSSRVLLETLLQLLTEMRAGLCTKLKVLILMCLYNISINLKGLQYISESPGFIPLLAWLLEDPDADVCLHVLRLIQSLVLEPEVFSRVKPQIGQSVSEQRIRELSSHRHPDLRSVATELLDDLKALGF
ncbi:heat shock factor 2-binding protein [Rhinoraja longicauda]